MAVNVYLIMAGLGGRMVRDCHAEILARRGLLKYLYNELNVLLDLQTFVDPVGKLGGHSSAFEFNRVTGLFSFKEGCSLHLYSSSQPCGNATIKKWAKAKQPQKFPSLSIRDFPRVIHSRLQVIKLFP